MPASTTAEKLGLPLDWTDSDARRAYFSENGALAAAGHTGLVALLGLASCRTCAESYVSTNCQGCRGMRNAQRAALEPIPLFSATRPLLFESWIVCTAPFPERLQLGC
jgi:hypothetical protein